MSVVELSSSRSAFGGDEHDEENDDAEEEVEPLLGADNAQASVGGPVTLLSPLKFPKRLPPRIIQAVAVLVFICLILVLFRPGPKTQETKSSIACQRTMDETWTQPTWPKCRDHVKEPCTCRDPTKPWNRSDIYAKWELDVERNQQMALEGIQKPLDIVFYGDSIIAHFAPQRATTVSQVFEQTFQSPDAPLHGLALGVKGDRCPNLLYRITKDHELPPDLHPKIIWIAIGTNDLDADACTAHAVTACIVNIVHQLRHVKPDTKIVINSILPRGATLLAENPLMSEITQTNANLECFAQATNNVFWLDVTNDFLSPQKDRINPSLFLDSVHPNELGAHVWTHKITEFALEILKSEDEFRS